MSAKELSYLLVGVTSQGRGSNEQERGSDPPIIFYILYYSDMRTNNGLKFLLKSPVKKF